MMRSFPCAYPALYRGLETVSVHSPVCVRGNAGLARKYGAEAVIFLKAALRSDFRKRQVLSLAKAMARLAVIDSRRWISFLLDLLPRLDNVDFHKLSDLEKRMLQMFYITVWGGAYPHGDGSSNPGM